MACTPEFAAALLQTRLSPRRRAHCLGTAGFAALLCARHALDPEKGHLAGLVHDLARELPPSQLLRLAEAEGARPSEWERAAPVLLHGRAAARLLRESFGLEDTEVLTAVCDHVTGRPRMPRLSKVLFCADFLEPSRDFVDDALRGRALELSLEGATALVLEEVLAFMRREGKWVAPPALELYEELRGDVAKKA